jgi:hypothetical protein
VTVYVAAFVALTLCQVAGLVGLTVLFSDYHSSATLTNPFFPGWQEGLHRHDDIPNNHKHHKAIAAAAAAAAAAVTDDHPPVPQLIDDQMEEIEKRLFEEKSTDESLARQAIQTLMYATLNDTTHPALDDYYHRRSRSSNSHSNNDNPDSSSNKSVLIIGGSDGSGTRAFADIVRTTFRVPLLVDDEGTLDVHGTALFAHHRSNNQRGWPPLVQLVLSQTHNANYNISIDLPTPVRRKALAQLDKLQRSWASRIADLQRSNNNNTTTSTAIAYGFKAPVTLVLLPLLLEAFHGQEGAKTGSIKFIHVVRDGRDISFSRNRSPVTKFYTTMYPPGVSSSLAEQRHYSSAHWLHIQAMQLWNAWNTQALQWARHQSYLSRTEPSAPQFEYLVVRAEDLLNDQTRYETFLRLAHFVGSSASPTQVCHASCQGLVDLGQSGVGKDGRQHYRYKQGDKNNNNNNKGNEKEGRTITEYVDEVDDISMEAVALQSEQYALDVAVQHLRPNVYKHLQEIRQEQTARRHQKTNHNHNLRTIKEQTTTRGGDTLILQAEHVGGRINNQSGERPRHRIHQPRRRLVETESVTSHDNTKSSKNKNMGTVLIGQRYGKWKAILQNDRVLSAHLHRHGKEGLEAFGYEPPRRFADLPPGGVLPCTCVESLERISIG